tara:strand:+ start:434 stop:562 length:129 start_codon:yes stop_codon:yes gene_type:complete
MAIQFGQLVTEAKMKKSLDKLKFTDRIDDITDRMGLRGFDLL